MNRSDTRKQVTPSFGGQRLPKDDDGDYDGTDSSGFGKVDMPKQARTAMGMKNSMDDDEAEDEGMEGPVAQEDAPNHAKGDRMTNRADQDEEEASEMRQKSGTMGTKGMKGTADKIQGQHISDEEELENPANKVMHGRDAPSGHEPDIEGSHQGSGHGGVPRHFSNLGHGEREAKIGGSHMGHGTTGGMAGEGFDAGGKLGRERAKGPTGTKR